MNNKSLTLLMALCISISVSTPTHAGIGKGLLGIFATAGGAVIGYQWGKTAEQDMSTVDMFLRANSKPDFFKKLDQVGNESQGRWALGSMVIISSIVGYFLGAPIGLGFGTGLIGGYIEGRVLEESRPLADKFEKKVATLSEKLEQGLKEFEKEFTKK
jgi:hypothetical protein